MGINGGGGFGMEVECCMYLGILTHTHGKKTKTRKHVKGKKLLLDEGVYEY